MEIDNYIYVYVFNCRCKFDVQMEDASSIALATVFGKNAEKLFSFKANDLVNNTNELKFQILKTNWFSS